jgi:hypothetical protein
MESIGIADGTAAAVMLSETLPRMAHERGPEWLAAMLAKLSQHIRAGLRSH